MTGLLPPMDECQQMLIDESGKYSKQIEAELSRFIGKQITGAVISAIEQKIKTILLDVVSRFPRLELKVFDEDGRLYLRWFWNIERSIVWSRGGGSQEKMPRQE